MAHRSTLLIFALIGGLAFSAAASSADLPDLLDKALARPAGNMEEWHFTRSNKGEAQGEKFVSITDRHDPTKPEGERFEILQACDPSGKPLSPDEYDPSDHEQDYDAPDYAELRDLFDRDIRLIEENDRQATYSFKPAKDKVHDFGQISSRDLDGDIAGRVVVVKEGRFAPYISDVSVDLDKPKGNLIAKVDDLKIKMKFAPEGAEGEMLAQEFAFLFDFRALAFINVDIDIETSYSDFKKAEMTR